MAKINADEYFLCIGYAFKSLNAAINHIHSVLISDTGIILAVVIGFSLGILIVIMILLYTCSRYRHKRKFRRLLSFFGHPAPDDEEW